MILTIGCATSQDQRDTSPANGASRAIITMLVASVRSLNGCCGWGVSSNHYLFKLSGSRTDALQYVEGSRHEEQEVP